MLAEAKEPEKPLEEDRAAFARMTKEEPPSDVGTSEFAGGLNPCVAD